MDNYEVEGMRFASTIRWDSNGRFLDADYFEYEGQVAECKGQSTADQQRTQELNMQTQAFQTQQAQLQSLQKAFSGYLQGNQGFNPQMLSSMRSQFLNNNNQTFNQAGQQVRSALGARGAGTGSQPVGGDYTRGIASLMGAKAGSQSQGLLGLNVQNAQQALTNQFNAGNLLSGNAATLTGTQGVAGNAASSALGSFIQGSNSPGWASGIAGLAGQLGGAAMTYSVDSISGADFTIAYGTSGAATFMWEAEYYS